MAGGIPDGMGRREGVGEGGGVIRGKGYHDETRVLKSGRNGIRRELDGQGGQAQET